MSAGNNNLKSNKKESKFFILTQQSGCSSTSTQVQLSQVRSHLAAQQHAQRRKNKSIANGSKRMSARASRGARDHTAFEQDAPPAISNLADNAQSAPPLSNIPSASLQSAYGANSQPDVPLDLTFAGTTLKLISLPLDLTTNESQALHFCLTVGPQKLLNSSSDIKYCPCTDIAQSLVHICPIYVLAHVVLGEKLLSERTQRPPRPYYYARFAQMYRAVSSTLASSQATFGHKLWAIIQAAMIERTTKRYDLQAIHNKALDDLFESHEGILTAHSAQADDTYLQISSRFYAGPLARATALSPIISNFDTVKERFALALTEIQDQVNHFHCTFTTQQFAATDIQPQLRQLGRHLETLSKSYCPTSTTEERLEWELGVLFCLLSIARTFVECPCSQQTTLNFLSQVQSCLEDRIANSLHPAATSYGISRIRSNIFPMEKSQTEFKISRTMVDAHMPFFLARPVVRTKIVTWLIACISTTANLASQFTELESGLDIVKNFAIRDLAEELELAWNLANLQTST